MLLFLIVSITQVDVLSFVESVLRKCSTMFEFPLHFRQLTVILESGRPTNINLYTMPWPNFIIKDLRSVLILIIADQLLNDSLCCSYKYN